MAAAAVRAYNDEQLAMVTNSQIVSADDTDAVRRALAQIPREQIVALIKHMPSNPQLLDDINIASLASRLNRCRQVKG